MTPLLTGGFLEFRTLQIAFVAHNIIRHRCISLIFIMEIHMLGKTVFIRLLRRGFVSDCFLWLWLISGMLYIGRHPLKLPTRAQDPATLWLWDLKILWNSLKKEGRLNINKPLHHYTLQWRHDGRDSVSNHQPHDCLPNHLFRCSSRKTSKLRVTGFCTGNSPVTGEFPAQMASNAENVSILLRHHEEFWLSGVPDLWDRNKILRGGDLSHLHVPDCIWVFFYFVWFVFIHHNFYFYFGYFGYLPTAFTKSIETQNCLAGIQNFLHFLWHIWFRVMDNIVRYRHAKILYVSMNGLLSETFLC